MRGGIAISKRTLRAGIMALAVLPLLVTGASAQTQNNALPSSQGWYWDRPSADPPSGTEDQTDVVGDPIGQQIAPRAFSGDHLYVGWDPADPEDNREMIAGVAFDFFAMDIPVGASITEFVVTALENPGANGTVNEGEAATQGIVACPWPDFLAGSAASSMEEAPEDGGDCDVTKVAGQKSENPVKDDLHSWTFDITSIIAEIWSVAGNPAFSLEPNPDQSSSQPWTTSFRASTYAEPKDEEDPLGEQVEKPGIIAKVSWIAPVSIGGDDFGIDDFTTGDTSGTSTGGSGSDVGGDGGLVDGPSEPSEPPVGEGEGVPVAGAFHGPSADFWDIPLAGWLGALVGMIVLGLAGVTLQGQPVTESRPAGAVNALMRGSDASSGEEGS
jgi:hypothetical protein